MVLVAIDPGHGGDNRGAQANGIIEADWNMSFARMLHMLYHESVLLRSRDDEPVALMERGRRSEEAAADLVVSIHVNAHSDHPQWHGGMCFHYPGSRLGRKVGDTIARCMPKPLLKPGWSSIAADDADGKWLERPANVLRVHAAPTVLVEVGYCTNVKDAAALQNEVVQKGLVYAILQGVLHFQYLTGE